MAGITENDLLEALQNAVIKAPKEARTSKEIAKLMGWSRDKVEDAIGRLAMMNRIEVHYVYRPRMDKQLHRVPAYTILPKQKRKK